MGPCIYRGRPLYAMHRSDNIKLSRPVPVEREESKALLPCLYSGMGKRVHSTGACYGTPSHHGIMTPCGAPDQGGASCGSKPANPLGFAGFGSDNKGFSEQHNSRICSFGFIHCRISVFEKGISRFSICGIHGNADTCTYRDNFPI